MIRWPMAAMLAALLAATANAAPAPAPASIEARMQRVEDEIAIRRVLIDYAAFLDARDYARYAELFAADGEWANARTTRKGRAAIRAMLGEMLGPEGAANRANYHIITNARIDLDGDRATATSRYLFVQRGTGGAPTPALAGVYRDELVRLGGAWKIRRRVAESIMPTSEEMRQRAAAGVAAK